MNISIDPKMQQFIEEKVRSGQYNTAEDVIRAGLITLQQQEAYGEFAPGELDELLGAAEASIQQHGAIPAEEVFDELRHQRHGRKNTAS